jgi:hypothetical protein
VGGGERLGGAGLGQRGGAGQGAGLAVQDFQIVVQIKDFGPLPMARWCRATTEVRS